MYTLKLVGPLLPISFRATLLVYIFSEIARREEKGVYNRTESHYQDTHINIYLKESSEKNVYTTHTYQVI